jgi:O-antigen ligase
MGVKDPAAVHDNITAIWITAFILANLRATIFWSVIVVGFGFSALPWVEILVWIVLALLLFRSISQQNSLLPVLSSWKRNWPLAVFISIVLFSVSWSIAPAQSLYRSLAVLFAALIGAYLGFRFSNRDLLRILYHFGAFLFIMCVVIALVIPPAGTMLNEPYTGSWRGVFWHKNQLGAVVPLFNLIYLLFLLEKSAARKWKDMLQDFIFYLVSLVLAVLSRSAAALIAVILLNALAILAYIWTKIHNRLRVAHYGALLGAGLFLMLLGFANLDTVLGLFNRNTSLTGRVPLWEYLLSQVIGRSPWIGYGFGAVWSLESFRTGTQRLLGWGYPIVIADNGFLDILLHVGLAGFVPFAAVLLTLLIRSARYAWLHRSILDFFPLLFFIYAILSNITFSMLLETETFIWLLIVALLFMLTPGSRKEAANPS